MRVEGEAALGGLLERALEHVARVGDGGQSVGCRDVTEHAGGRIDVAAPRKDLEGRGVGVSEQVGLEGAREPLDRRAVEAETLAEGPLDLGRGDGDRLQGAHHIREPQPDELDPSFLDRAKNEVALLIHPGPFSYPLQTSESGASLDSGTCQSSPPHRPRPRRPTPMAAGAASVPGPRRVRTRHFQNAKANGIPITGLTSYDQMTARIFDEAGIDFLLVGDSAGNNVFGYDTTLPVTVDELIPLTRAVAHAATRAFVVADMPFGSYESGPDEALHTAVRFMKETGAHAVKLEGGVRSQKQIRRIVSSGIPVMAHIGFTPQSEHGLGGHIIQGRGNDAARLVDDALAVQDAGAFAVVLEMVPSGIAAEVTKRLDIPTIGVGAGPDVDGQLLVWTDFAGMSDGRVPRFVRQYANVRQVLLEAVGSYRADVASGAYPAPEHSYE